jgi:transmembrane sensor
MQSQHILYLLEQHLAGQLTEAQQNELDKIMQNSEYEDVVKGCLLQLLGHSDEETQPGGSEILQGILSVDKTAGRAVTSQSGLLFFWRRPVVRRFAVAAALLATVVGAWFFLHKPKTGEAVAKAAPKAAIIKPGSNRAVLTLANGQQIVLDDAHNGVLGQQGKTRVIKLDSGRLAYADGAGGTAGAGGSAGAGTGGGNAGGKDAQTGAAAILFNTIATPRGGQYQITLPDRTKVWLNAESSLRFPTAFTEKQRTVELTGEAYFEVAPNKDQPFLVKAGTTETRVLGTQFNVMAYGDEGPVKTTLLEGAVQMGLGQVNTLLTPGLQGQYDAEKGRMATRMVNTRQVTAWKDGYYFFDRTPVQSIMRQISRWYDVQIVYQGQAPRDEIVGKIPRTADVSEVLHIMELIGIRFRIEGRTITVLA